MAPLWNHLTLEPISVAYHETYKGAVSVVRATSDRRVVVHYTADGRNCTSTLSKSTWLRCGSYSGKILCLHVPAFFFSQTSIKHKKTSGFCHSGKMI